MIKRPFFGFGKPKLKYPVVKTQGQDAIMEIPTPRRVTLFLKDICDKNDDLFIKPGDEVKTGQKLRLMEGDKRYIIASATGTVKDISQYKGYLGQTYTAVGIDTAEEDQWDNEFTEAGQKPDRETAVEFLSSLPGNPDFQSLLDIHSPMDTIIINGIDKDLLVTTNHLVVETEIENIKVGIEHLKKIIGPNKIMMVVPPDLTSKAQKTGVDIHVIEPTYPKTLPKIIVKRILGRVVPAGKRCVEMGVGFISSETIVALASAFANGRIPIYKMLTVINKDNTPINVKARIGTPVKDVLNALDIETGHGDRLILGGPMTGHAIYSEDIPISSDTDAIMIQDKNQIAFSLDSHCINCGECVRACPAKIPVNMLVRLLENSLFDEAAREYDLLCCIECGLCSYVCIAQIPLFHYIMLGKYQLARIASGEESNA